MITNSLLFINKLSSSHLCCFLLIHYWKGVLTLSNSLTGCPRWQLFSSSTSFLCFFNKILKTIFFLLAKLLASPICLISTIQSFSMFILLFAPLLRLGLHSLEEEVMQPLWLGPCKALWRRLSCSAVQWLEGSAL